jgi:hypothetical protein
MLVLPSQSAEGRALSRMARCRTAASATCFLNGRAKHVAAGREDADNGLFQVHGFPPWTKCPPLLRGSLQQMEEGGVTGFGFRWWASNNK